MTVKVGDWLQRVILAVLLAVVAYDHKQLTTLLANPPVAPVVGPVDPKPVVDPAPATPALVSESQAYVFEFARHFHAVAEAGKAGRLADKPAAAAMLAVDATKLNDAINASLDKGDASTWVEFEAVYKSLSKMLGGL